MSTTDESISSQIAYNIESELNKLHPENIQLSEYNTKTRSLLYNLKKNENLRSNLLSHTLSPHHLIHMTPNELATNEMQLLREKIGNDDKEERRLDWVEAHKEEIQADNGLDPNNVWEYEKEVESDID